jgi:tartrate-resistant acid phosphatase type 5
MCSARALFPASAAALLLGACTLHAAAAPGAPDGGPGDAAAGTVRFAVVGDFGVDDAREAAVARLIASWNPAFVVTTGDDNYPDGAAETIDKNVGKYFAPFIGHYKGAFGTGSAENRFWPTPGNHDWRGKQGLKPYLDYFTLPGNGRYYDVVLLGGKVHLFALDSDPREPDGTSADSAQARWAERALRASSACLKLVAFHHPPYSSARHGPSLYMRWPFAAWGASAVLSGHDHAYERSEIDGIPYIVTGLGGASTYEFHAAQEGSQVRFNDDLGATLVTVGKGLAAIEFWTTGGVRVDRRELRPGCL